MQLMGRAPGSQHVAGARSEGQRAQLLGALRRLELWKNRDPELLDSGRDCRRIWVELLGVWPQRGGDSGVLEKRIPRPIGAKEGRGQEVPS